MERTTRPAEWIRLLAALALALAAPGCDEATSPVAPTGNVLTVTADPAAIGLQGSSSITASLRLANGVPGREGTEITFSTDLGRIEPAVVRTDADGIARATFTADGRIGSAQILAASGGVSAQTSVSVQSGPSASFTSRSNGLQVIFTDSSSGNPTSWAWSFGDGATSGRQNPVHTYAAAGTYTVTLTVANADGESTASDFVTVSTAGPTASFSFQTNNLTVIFSDQSSGDPTSWAWDFGDGGASRTQSPTHTYAAEGTYTVSLTVANAAGSDTTSSFVTVSLPPPPAANFSFQADGLTVIFSDQSSGSPTGWQWDFGDGGASGEQNPTHAYAAAGTYTVTLTVSDDFGRSSSTSLFVTLF